MTLSHLWRVIGNTRRKLHLTKPVFVVFVVFVVLGVSGFQNFRGFIRME